MHTYLRPTENQPHFQVGSFAPDGTWLPVRNYIEEIDAIKFIHFLNGGAFYPDPREIPPQPDPVVALHGG